MRERDSKSFNALLSDMTLRDILAGFALIADNDHVRRSKQNDKETAAHTYVMADAMLEIHQHNDSYEDIG